MQRIPHWFWSCFFLLVDYGHACAHTPRPMCANLIEQLIPIDAIRRMFFGFEYASILNRVCTSTTVTIWLWTLTIDDEHWCSTCITFAHWREEEFRSIDLIATQTPTFSNRAQQMSKCNECTLPLHAIVRMPTYRCACLRSLQFFQPIIFFFLVGSSSTEAGID